MHHSLPSTAVTAAVQRKITSRSLARGELLLPCLPALCEQHMERIERLMLAFDQPLSAEQRESLQALLEQHLDRGFQASPNAQLRVQFGPETSTQGLNGPIRLDFDVITPTLEEHYRLWPESRQEPLFGSYPDARLMALASTLTDPTNAPVLDIGAGVGRNSLPLARRGHPVDALELTTTFADMLCKAVQAEDLPVIVTRGDILHPRLGLRPCFYQLALASEVISHFRNVEQVRTLFSKVATSLVPGGVLLCNSFLAAENYTPTPLVWQTAQLAWSFVLTRPELHAALEGLPLRLEAVEPALAYEQQHLPPEAWPPTPWFPSWAAGRDVSPGVTPPFELCWLVLRRTET
ncbi:MAG: class I SAM-dependent methyltransferase [Chloroflexaceae bacterium]|nr:class I SAM-dependent methyltransferase [Chloroflexaceae bacterium]